MKVNLLHSSLIHSLCFGNEGFCGPAAASAAAGADASFLEEILSVLEPELKHSITTGTTMKNPVVSKENCEA
jgi:hypothetical protein